MSFLVAHPFVFRCVAGCTFASMEVVSSMFLTTSSITVVPRNYYGVDRWLGTKCLAVRVNLCYSQLHESCEQLLDQSGRRSHCPHIVYVALNIMVPPHALNTGKEYFG